MDTNPVAIGRQNRSEAPVKLADEYYSIISVDKLPGANLLVIHIKHRYLGGTA